MDANGNLVRTLVKDVQGGDLLASWALDRDDIGYVQGQVFKDVDVTGKALGRFNVLSRGYGCGGGPPPPTDQLYWNETGYEGVIDSLVWSMRRHFAAVAYGCASPVLVADTASGRTLPLFTHQWAEPALSVGSQFAITTGCQIAFTPGQYARAQCLSLVDVRTGSLEANLGVGGLPAWSRDGRTLYFVRRTGKQLMHMTGPFYVRANGSVMGSDEPRDDLAFVTSIWMTQANGSHPVRITSLDAFGTGPLQVTRDGRSLIFSLVDNPWNLYHHLLPSGRYTAALLQRYGPHVSIRRLDLVTGRITTIIRDAGRPAVQP